MIGKTYLIFNCIRKEKRKLIMEKNMITWKAYLNKFEEILQQGTHTSPYDDPDFLDYVKLNYSRLNRWLKKGEINTALKEKINHIDQKQTWYLITEPWCGDAAHSAPFIYLMTKENPNITLKVVLRDTPPFMIDNYLTNGGKSIPKLVIRDQDEKDIFVWGPRPEKCQDVYQELKNEGAELDTIKVELQKWYNKDKGVSIQNEFSEILSQIKAEVEK